MALWVHYHLQYPGGETGEGDCVVFGRGDVTSAEDLQELRKTIAADFKRDFQPQPSIVIRNWRVLP